MKGFLATITVVSFLLINIIYRFAKIGIVLLAFYWIASKVFGF